MTVKRIGPGYYVITDAQGVEWDASRRNDIDPETGDERPSTYWMATDGQGGYIEEQTLRQIKKILLGA